MPELGKIFYIDKGWTLHLAPRPKNNGKINITDTIPATIPGTVHTDLLNAGVIPDPFYGDNEGILQWIHEYDWRYENIFDVPSDLITSGPVFMICEGLDTVAKIYLNGKLLGKTDNMFRKYEFLVAPHLREKKNNLAIVFQSPIRFARTMEKKYGKLPVALASERTYIRKAQYSFGWDWGPAFPTMGIWKPIYFKAQTPVFIKNVRFHTLSISRNRAEVQINLDLTGKTGDYKFEIWLKNGKELHHVTSKVRKKSYVQIRYFIKNPVLWWPNGEGEPGLYELSVHLKNSENELVDEKIVNVGIRTIRLLLHDKKKQEFRFLVNGRVIFMKGANWIPADSFLTRIDDKKYENLLGMARDCHMNMIRVWGGGVYENDHFYECCDRLGLLVWQDFMFACGIYPTHPDFIETIEEEFRQNINRLQYHPSLAIWCGNNENDWGWFVTSKKPLKEMPDFRIYHKILPEMLEKLDPMRSYWPSSPFGKDQDPNSTTSGNRHNWDMWSGWEDYTEVSRDQSLFITEFGFQGPASRSTLEQVIPKEQRFPQSYLFEFHNKQVEGTERVFRLLAGHLPVRTGWADFIYLSQLIQGMALKHCIEHWRMLWPRTTGTIIWQLNDCWPVTSWSLIDSEFHQKMAYHLVRETYKPTIIGFLKKNGKLIVVGLNSSQKEFRGRLQIDILQSEFLQTMDNKNIPVRLKPGKVTEIFSLSVSKGLADQNRIVVSTLSDENGTQIHRNIHSQKRWKHMSLPKANLTITTEDESPVNHVFLAADRPVFFADLYHPDWEFSDRGFTLLHGERKKVSVITATDKKLNLQEIQGFMLNNYLNDKDI